MSGWENGVFRTRIRARSYELDGFRHVNNAVFVQYLEAARGDCVRSVGLGYADFHRWGVQPVVRRVEVRYLKPVAADEEIEIALRFVAWRRTGFSLEYTLIRLEDGVKVAEAMTEHAFIDWEGRPVRVPTEFAAAFAPYRNGVETHSNSVK